MTLEEGEQKVIEVQPGDVQEVTDETPQARIIIRKDEGQTKRTLGYVFGGIGIASLAGAAVFGVLAYKNNQTIEKDCNASTNLCLTKAGQDAPKEGATNALLANVLAAAGAVSLGVGGYFLYTAPSEPSATVEAGVFKGIPALRVSGTF